MMRRQSSKRSSLGGRLKQFWLSRREGIALSALCAGANWAAMASFTAVESVEGFD